MVEAASDEELTSVVRASDAAGEPVLLVGGGSNLLVADSGFPGTVVRIRTLGIQPLAAGADQARVRVAAGEPWDRLVAHAVDHGWAGLEALSGIPGTVGATPIQNVGAYGVEVSQVIESVDVLDRGHRAARTLAPDDLGLGYRTSALKQRPGRLVVLAVTLRLARSALSVPVRYAELAAVLGVEVGQRAPLSDVRDAVLALRRGKGMVLDPRDHDTWSAGSFFTNPVLDAEQADLLPAGAPRFPQPDGRVKTSAAWLISHAGFDRGFALGPGAQAALSTKHALALTNRGGASTADLLELARVVRAGVQARFAVTLEPEPVLVGCAL